MTADHGYAMEDGYPRAWRVGDVVKHRDIDTGPRKVTLCMGAWCALSGDPIDGLTFNLAQAGDLRTSTPSLSLETSTCSH